MKRRILPLIIGLLLLLNTAYAYGEATELEPADIVITLNGQTMILEEPPYIIEGRTLLPLRYIFEPLGLEVYWIEETRTAVGKKDGLTIELPIGSVSAIVNGEVMVLDVPATIINNRTYVPVRFVAESTGSVVGWDSETRTVSIIASLENYESLSINQILISIYGDVNDASGPTTDAIRDKYHVIVKKIEDEANKNDLSVDEFKSVVVSLGQSFGIIIDPNQPLQTMLETLNDKKQENSAQLVLDLKSKYEVYEYDSGDKYYGPYTNGVISGLGLYEFSGGNILITHLTNARRNGFTTNITDIGYQYGEYLDDELEGYEFSYNKFEETSMISLTHYSSGKREGKYYELRYDNNGNLLYDKYGEYSDDVSVGISEINFNDGTNRFDRANSSINDIVVRIDTNGEYFILPTDSKGISVSSRTGFGYKKFEDGIEYIGEFFEESRLAEGLYYATDDSSKLSTNLMDQRAIEIIEQIINENQTYEEKIRIIYDYLAEHVRYDPNPDENNKYKNVSHTAYGALINGEAVCDGYAEAFKYLLNKIDVDSAMIFGEAYDDGTAFTQVENHAWNLVKVENAYHHFDLTWDDDDLNKIINYDFYKKESMYFDDTHWWNTEDYLGYLKD